jgi:predicted ATPase
VKHQEARSWAVRSAASLARLWERQGKREEARRVLADAYAWFTEGFEGADLRTVQALLAELA